ncbi:MAG: helix-turn-helix transcriptional regulator [Liquorilactobacillus nagelii]|uniref:helix-turn-helix domain-containing protein n=1 Tax=Lactobacillaceae TaxID=33958 RepID=UPI0039E77A60
MINNTTENVLRTNIVNLREKKNWTQADLAKHIGLENSAISKIESGVRKVSSTELQNFASVFGVSTDYLLGNKSQSSNTRTEKDLKEFLDRNLEQGMTYDHEKLTDEDKERLKIALTQIFWKRHNKSN